MSDPQPAEPEALLSLAHVCARTALAKSSIYRMVARGDFPTQVQVLPGRTAWLASEVAAWISSRPRVDGSHARRVDILHHAVERAS
jgi:prophage regulatory protein